MIFFKCVFRIKVTKYYCTSALNLFEVYFLEVISKIKICFLYKQKKHNSFTFNQKCYRFRLSHIMMIKLYRLDKEIMFVLYSCTQLCMHILFTTAFYYKYETFSIYLTFTYWLYLRFLFLFPQYYLIKFSAGRTTFNPVVDHIASRLGYYEPVYAVVIDAGSTGSRVLAYTFHKTYLGNYNTSHHHTCF